MKIYYIQHDGKAFGLINSLEFLFKDNIITKAIEHLKFLRIASIMCDAITKIITGLYVVFILLFFFGYPLISYFVYEEIQPIVPVYIPGIDESSTAGFIIMTTFHVIFVTFGGISFAAIDCVCVIIILGAVIYGFLIKLDANALNDELRNNGGDRISVKVRFRNILMMQREMATYGTLFLPPIECYLGRKFGETMEIREKIRNFLINFDNSIIQEKIRKSENSGENSKKKIYYPIFVQFLVL